MKHFLCLLMLLSFSFIGKGQDLNPEYDSLLARRLGADDYGMKKYVLVILKTGPARYEAGPALDSLFRGHLDNINRLAEGGKLFVAGPLGKNDHAYRGIFILNVRTIDEAKELVLSDPAIREKIFDTEMFEWYGSAALGEYLNAGRKAARYMF